ncbi:MAG: non-hydrolyzing UDP-N-acetylglucosamine 2-epimerase [Agriterribacter sp.]
MNNQHDILFIIGTRPELIKVAPVIRELITQKRKNFVVINTGQHRELLEQYWSIFGIAPDYQLEILSPGQDLSLLTVKAISKLSELVGSMFQKSIFPKVILAQGDTTTVMAASMVAFYYKIKFVHLEAGLRSNDLYQPFPEEFNRRVASIVASYHLVPTQMAKENLLRENVDASRIRIVGNTVIDSLEFIRSSPLFKASKYNNEHLQRISHEQRIVLITCHRRENHGKNLEDILSGVEYLVKEFPHMQFVWVLHPNPNVKRSIESSPIQINQNFTLVTPLDYLDILQLMDRCTVIITDSGGIQEEAPSFGKPVLILRENTERPEAVNNGMAKLVGSKTKSLIDGFHWAVAYSPVDLNNPYGDGHSAKRVVDILNELIK